jgi:hypothetical protein
MLRRVMATLLFETAATDPVALAATASLLLLAALGACGRRPCARRVWNPLAALRQER